MNLILTFTIALGVVASKAFGINKVHDINEVVRAQMENLIQKYNARKMTEGHVYESLRDANSLQSIRNELLNSFRKTVISTGKKLSEQKFKNGQSGKTVVKSTKRKNVAKAPIRRRRMEFLQKHYGQTFETPKSEWSRHLARYHWLSVSVKIVVVKSFCRNATSMSEIMWISLLVFSLSRSYFQLEVYSQNKNQEKSFYFRLVPEVLLVDCIVNRLCHRWLQKSTFVSLYSWLHTMCDISYAIWHNAFILDF